MTGPWKATPPPVPPLPTSSSGSATDALRAAADALEARQRPGGGAEDAEHGERLATLPRKDGVEVRVTWDRYKGSPYLGIREWVPGRGPAAMFPTKKGVTVRPSELPALARAVADAIDRAIAEAG